jgi:hypothetical protein
LYPLREFAGQSLVLQQQIGAGRRELTAPSGAVTGWLDIPFVGDSSAHAAEGSWHFDRQGLTQTQVAIQSLPAGWEIARFTWDDVFMSGGGNLTFPDGRWFRWDKTSAVERRQIPPAGVFPGEPSPVPVKGDWAFLRPDGAPVVGAGLSLPQQEGPVQTYRWGTGRTTAQLAVDFRPEAPSVAEHPLLTLLATFLVWWWTTLREQVHR